MSYECGACEEEFSTLSGKRLHECPEGAQYGGDKPDENIPVADLDLDQTVSLAVEQALICDVCGASNDYADELDQTESDRGVSFSIKFECESCGAHNDNSAVLE